MKFINKSFIDINEINLYMYSHPTYIVKQEVCMNGLIYIKFGIPSNSYIPFTH